MSVRSYHFGSREGLPDFEKLIEMRSMNPEFKAVTDLITLVCEGGRHPYEAAYMILDWYNPIAVRSGVRP